jgi:hypothetical protein
MKKIVTLSLLIVASVFTNFSKAQVSQGSVLVDAYYGFPNLYTTVFKTAYANSGEEINLKISGIGPLGIRAEYLISDKIGIGIDAGFNNTNIQYTEQGVNSVYDSITGLFVDEPYEYDYNFSTQKIGVIATFNYHFVQNDKVDAYAVVGGGYGSRSFKYETNDPSFEETTIKGVIPVASKIGVGMRYFFTENIGANFAVGIGQGGLVNVGLSAKF